VTIGTVAFMQSRQVFSLAEARRALLPGTPIERVRNRLKRYLSSGRLLSVSRGVYAAVPFGIDAEGFQPDPFLVASSVRSDAVFSHYSAITLLGAARVVWKVLTVLTTSPRPPLEMKQARVDFLVRPPALVRRRETLLGVRSVDRSGRTLRVTGPERTLVEGFRSPRRVGGLAELVAASAGFPVLDLDLLERVLRAYDEKILWAAVGWFLEKHRAAFSVPDAYLALLESRRPRSRVYLARGEGPGRLASRWNLMLPDSLTSPEPDEREG
jgi:predicted transcriptional regulator of viral defense system